MVSSNNVIAAELISPRDRWKTVADAVTIMIPTAAHVISHGAVRVSPGRVIPTAASTYATPTKSWNHRGSAALICAAICGGGERKSKPCARNAAASSACKTQSKMFMTSPASSIAGRLSDHQVERDETVAAVRRTTPGENPITRLNVRLKAASDS
jgi:hypothetical protein